MRSTDTIFVSLLTIVSALAIGCNRDTADDKGEKDTKSERGAETPPGGHAAGGGQASNQADAPGPAVSSQLPEEAREFILAANQDGLIEVEAGRLAERNAHTESLRQFAHKMVEDYSKANEELARFARAKNLEVPKALTEEGQDRLDKLRDKSGHEFDQQYVARLIDEHQKTIRRFERQAEAKEDPELSQWATQWLPALRTHLDEAKRIKESLADKEPAATHTPTGMESPSGMAGGAPEGGGETKAGGAGTKPGGAGMKTGDTKTGDTKTGDTKTGGTKTGGAGTKSGGDTKTPDAKSSAGG